MNGQQAPQPVVRPLPRFTTLDELDEFIAYYPADEYGNKEIVGSWEFENGKCTPIVLFLSNMTLDLYTVFCDQDHKVDSSGIVNEVKIAELPCYTDIVSMDSVTLLNNIAGLGGWAVGEYANEPRADYNNKLMRFILSLE